MGIKIVKGERLRKVDTRCCFVCCNSKELHTIYLESSTGRTIKTDICKECLQALKDEIEVVSCE